MLTVKIDPERWCRGAKHEPSKLLNQHGYMCCLGFLGEALGVPKDDMEGTAMPNGLTSDLADTFTDLGMDHIFLSDLAVINDATSLGFADDGERVTCLNEKLAVRGVKLEFVLEETA